jgi:hypothetical protein
LEVVELAGVGVGDRPLESFFLDGASELGHHFLVDTGIADDVLERGS